jgi:hypothetical protein
MTSQLHKELKKKAQTKHPGRMIQWIGGVLYFRDQGWPPTEVPGVKKMPKAQGFSALVNRPLPMVVQKPLPKPEPKRQEYRSSSYWD